MTASCSQRKNQSYRYRLELHDWWTLIHLWTKINLSASKSHVLGHSDPSSTKTVSRLKMFGSSRILFIFTIVWGCFAVLSIGYRARLDPVEKQDFVRAISGQRKTQWQPEQKSRLAKNIMRYGR
ncbi:hypothetical protein CRM22_003714 [Opisthorchis felineus]|uniref:Uncharacterized protein n=1 Tax=Opisthorchis felineus TaxID=147828 RepID=A0A4S2M4Y9_OPIFE|nr:hypothetical protein CRM22_003714 [Opisthorchis felineus]